MTPKSVARSEKSEVIGLCNINIVVFLDEYLTFLSKN